MRASISEIFSTITRQILKLTLYDMMRTSHDFEDVKAALNDRTDWSIELFRSCFTIHLGSGGYIFMMCALSFLVVAESIHIHYGRLSPAELKERAEHIGYATFAILFGVLDIGFVVVRIAGLAALSESLALTMGLTLVGMLPSVILLVLTYPVRFLKWRRHASAREVEVESGTMVDETREVESRASSCP